MFFFFFFNLVLEINLRIIILSIEIFLPFNVFNFNEKSLVINIINKESVLLPRIGF